MNKLEAKRDLHIKLMKKLQPKNRFVTPKFNRELGVYILVLYDKAPISVNSLPSGSVIAIRDTDAPFSRKESFPKFLRLRVFDANTNELKFAIDPVWQAHFQSEKQSRVAGLQHDKPRKYKLDCQGLLSFIESSHSDHGGCSCDIHRQTLVVNKDTFFRFLKENK